MDTIFNTFLKDLITIKKLKNVDKSDKKVVSTCIFMPENPSISHKTPVYITGLMKNIETFSSNMGEDWILRVYCDEMYFTGVTKKVIDEVARSDSETELSMRSNTSVKSNESLYKSMRNLSDFDNSKSNEYNNSVKENIFYNRENLKKIEKIMNFYLTNIINSKEERYKNIEIHTFNCPKATRGNPNFLGHYNTFGSIMRFLPMFDPDVSTTFCTNSRYTISPILKTLINDWDSNKKKKMFTWRYNTNFLEQSIYDNINFDIEEIRKRKKKRESKYFRTKAQTERRYKDEIERDSLFIDAINMSYQIKYKMFNESDPWSFDKISNKYESLRSDKCLQRLNGLINPHYEGTRVYSDDNNISVAAGIFGIKSNCDLINERKTMFAKMLAYHILSSKKDSFMFGIDEVYLRVFIAFEVGTMEYEDGSLDYKEFNLLNTISKEELQQWANSHDYNLEEMGVKVPSDLLIMDIRSYVDKIIKNGKDEEILDKFREINESIYDFKNPKIPYITNYFSHHEGSCINLAKLSDEYVTFLTDTNGNPLILATHYKDKSDKSDKGYNFREILDNNHLFDIRMYDAKSLFLKAIKFDDEYSYTLKKLDKDDKVVFNFCTGKDGDDLQLDLISLFSYFEEYKPLYLWNSHNLSDVNDYLTNILGKDKDNYYTLFDLQDYKTEKDLRKLISEILGYYRNKDNMLPYIINSVKLDTIDYTYKQIWEDNLKLDYKIDMINLTINKKVNEDLGVTFTEKKTENNIKLIVDDVIKNSPAKKAGIINEDIIVEINNLSLKGKNLKGLNDIIWSLKEDEIITVGIIRERPYLNSAYENTLIQTPTKKELNRSKFLAKTRRKKPRTTVGKLSKLSKINRSNKLSENSKSNKFSKSRKFLNPTKVRRSKLGRSKLGL